MRNALLFALALLAGCAPHEWHKDGANQQNFDRDEAACQFTARQPAPLDLSGSAAYGGSSSYGATPEDSEPRDAIRFDQCMKGQGWTRRELRKD